MENELSVLAAIIEADHADLPPYADKLIKHAPESFYDLRAAEIAVTVRTMRKTGSPVNFATISEKHLKLIDFIGGALSLSALPLESAEFYAVKCWQEYQVRRAKSIGSELVESLTSQPAQARTIIATARQALITVTDEAAGLTDRLTSRIYSPQVTLIEPETRFQLGGVQICTPGNLTTINSQAKVGKTAVVTAAIASTFARIDAECLGFVSQNPKGYAVIHIDTEQCPFDHHQAIDRAVKRAGAQAAPDWLRSYCLTGFSATDVRQSIRILLKEAKTRFSGIHSVFIDGTADACNDVNDPGESNSLVSELHDTAINYDCPILNIIHLNPGSDFKTRGHLGSQLERKSETNLRLEKNDAGVTVIFADKNRRAPIPKDTGPRFAWSDDHGMHLTVDSIKSNKDEMEHEKLQTAAQQWFNSHQPIRFTELKVTVKNVMTVGDRTAERKIKAAVNLGIIKHTDAGLYVLNT